MRQWPAAMRSRNELWRQRRAISMPRSLVWAILRMARRCKAPEATTLWETRRSTTTKRPGLLGALRHREGTRGVQSDQSMRAGGTVKPWRSSDSVTRRTSPSMGLLHSVGAMVCVEKANANCQKLRGPGGGPLGRAGKRLALLLLQGLKPVILGWDRRVEALRRPKTYC